MREKELSVKALCGLIFAGAFLSMALLSALAYLTTGALELLLFGGLLTLCALLWLIVLTAAFGRRLQRFTDRLCARLDRMLAGEAAEPPADADTLLDRVSQRLLRLWGVLREDSRRAEAQRQELQELVSDLSHQVKTPLSNLRMLTDTLLEKPLPEAERADFLRALRQETEKLSFLLEALVKTSRLESGLIQLQKRDAPLYDTLAQALGGIVCAAEKKGLAVSVRCPEDIRLPHDAKWTSEALLNLLDNAVKYTPAGGRIEVTAEAWEASVRVSVADTGRGIPPEEQTAIFRRFYREEAVHGEPGVGIGLYLAREIVARQGGFITVKSRPGEGSVFTVSLPKF